MKISLAPLLILLFLAIQSISQETKKVVTWPPGKTSKIVYYVLKANRSIKHGPYLFYNHDKLVTSGFYKDGKKDSVWQHYHSNGWVITKKVYTENKKTGIWEFYGKSGAIEWLHDFSGDSSIDKPKGLPGYSYQSSNGEWVQGKADRDPVRLASSYDWQIFIGRNLRYPMEAIDKGQQGEGVVEVTIDESGDPIEYSIAPETTYPLLGAEALRIVKLFEPEYLPAEKDGKKVKTKVPVTIKFRLRS